jgi:integrase
MRKHNPKNERIKRDYFDWLEQADGQSKHSVEQAAAAVADFERSTRFKDFKLFHIEQAKAFKRKLQDHRIADTGKPLATATIHTRLMAVKKFFKFLAGRPGYRRISANDLDYFNLTSGERRVATTKRATARPVPSLAMIRRVIEAMPNGTDIEKRDRALIAFAIVSGARDSAIASFRLKHVEAAERAIIHEPREGVRTKFSKTTRTWFFPVGEDLVAIVSEWIVHLREQLNFGPDDPLFPATATDLNAAGGFTAAGLDRRFWANADPIRRIFHEGFEAVGLPYHNPHSLRYTLARLRYELNLTPEEWKAWSQNCAHEDDATTLNSYGEVPAHRQAALLSDLRHGKPRNPGGLSDDDIIKRAVELMLKRR